MEVEEAELDQLGVHRRDAHAALGFDQLVVIVELRDVNNPYVVLLAHVVDKEKGDLGNAAAGVEHHRR
jgi:hypothetical protein